MASSIKPLGQEMLSLPNMKNNAEVINAKWVCKDASGYAAACKSCSAPSDESKAFSCCSRIFVSLVAGCLTGIAGVTGYSGFGVYLLAHVVVRCSAVATQALVHTAIRRSLCDIHSS